MGRVVLLLIIGFVVYLAFRGFFRVQTRGGEPPARSVKGEDMDQAARILVVSDIYDALTSDRPYRKGISLLEARAEVRRCSGTQFDPQCVAAFDQISDEQLAEIVKEREHPTEELLSLLD